MLIIKLCQDLEEMDIKVYDLFGSAPAFIIVDTNGKDVKDVIITEAKRIEEICQNPEKINAQAEDRLNNLFLN